MTRIWLPFPPSTNGLFSQRLIRGRVIRIPATRYTKWKKEAKRHLVGFKQIAGIVRLKLELTPPNKLARDADNYNKAVIDALVQNGILEDDSSAFVRSVMAEWNEPCAKTQGVVVRVTALKAKVPKHDAQQMDLLSWTPRKNGKASSKAKQSRVR